MPKTTKDRPPVRDAAIELELDPTAEVTPFANAADAAWSGEIAASLLKRPPRRGRDYRTRRLLVCADLLALVIGIASWSVLGAQHPRAHILWGLATVPIWIGLFTFYGLYASGLKRVGYATVDDIPTLGHALLVGTVAMWLYFQITPAGKLVFSELLAFVLITFVLVLLLRSYARALARRMFGEERVLFVGSGPMMPIVVRQMMGQRRHGMKPVGVLTREENERWPLPLENVGSLGAVDAVSVIHDYSVDRLIVSGEGIEDHALLEVVSLCRDLGVSVSALPSLAAMMGPAATVDHLEGITLIGLNIPSLARSQRY